MRVRARAEEMLAGMGIKVNRRRRCDGAGF